MIDLRECGIGVQLHYIPVHTQPFYKKMGFKNGDFPNSELYAKNAFSLPLFPGLSDSNQEFVVEKLQKILTMWFEINGKIKFK